MTQDEKTKITQLRQNGLSYSEISEKLNISINTISSFCRRNKIDSVVTPIVSKEIANNCKYCGTQLLQNGHRKSFCSDSCRYAWWNARRNIKAKNHKYISACKHCGKHISVYGKNGKKYCSHDCYIQDRFYKGDIANG